ncbi:serine carboxypeptidase S28-domain-containing protein [Dichotomocladium elegans]|nr:serine carboxypeptidase S28-domain-containing protein [Dichotomocladium elegans]
MPSWAPRLCFAPAGVFTDSRYGPFFFDQPIDHNDPDSPTFRHRYWANTDWYKPGGPVILYNAGELAADYRASYVTNSSMAMLARELDGIVIVMEHRCYGQSMIGKDYSSANLRALNTEQALEDMATIIREIKLPNLDVTLPPAPQTKWIVYGGSYSGNLAAWMRYRYPDIVFATIPSSAPVQMRYDFPEYFTPIYKYGPRHCIDAIEGVVRYVDHILFSPFGHRKQELKKRFGLEDLLHDDDFAETLSYPLGLWQDMTPTENPFESEFCSIFENAHSLHEYVDAYGSYITALVNRTCEGSASVNECLNTHDPQSEMYRDLTAEYRPWFWQICTEYAYWQTAAPLWRPTLVSRKLNTSWYQRQCPLLFGNDIVPRHPHWRRINADYKGWHLLISRAIWLDGEWDPWRTLSVNSDDAPDRTHAPKDTHYQVLGQSVHHWDFFITDTVSTEIKELHRTIVELIKTWITEADNGNGDYDGQQMDREVTFNYQQ